MSDPTGPDAMAATDAIDATDATTAATDEAEPSRSEPEEIDLEAMPGGARSAIEAVLMVVEEPLTPEALGAVLGIEPTVAWAHLHDLADEYDRDGRGFSLRRTEAGWRIYSRAEYAPVVERFVLEGRRATLSKAALETLAVIAYRQPVSRARIAAVRGVGVDGVVRTLMTRGLIDEVGTDTEHGAVLYGTTEYFLTRLGLASLAELPPLAPYLPEGHEVDEIAERGGI